MKAMYLTILAITVLTLQGNAQDTMLRNKTDRSTEHIVIITEEWITDSEPRMR